MLPLLQKISNKEGFGKLLAQGTMRMAEHFGNESTDFAMHVKGMEMGGYDPRGAKGMGLTYACGPRGGCHHAGGYSVLEEVSTREFKRHSTEGKAELVQKERNIRSSICDSGLMCAFAFALMDENTAAELLSAGTGFDFSVEELFVVGERIATLERAINVREGLTPEQDTLPKRLLNEAMKDGPNKDQIVELESMKREFYEICGWNPDTGMPTIEKVRELKLEGLLSFSKDMTQEVSK